MNSFAGLLSMWMLLSTPIEEPSFTLMSYTVTKNDETGQNRICHLNFYTEIDPRDPFPIPASIHKMIVYFFWGDPSWEFSRFDYKQYPLKMDVMRDGNTLYFEFRAASEDDSLPCDEES